MRCWWLLQVVGCIAREKSSDSGQKRRGKKSAEWGGHEVSVYQVLVRLSTFPFPWPPVGGPIIGACTGSGKPELTWKGRASQELWG